MTRPLAPEWNTRWGNAFATALPPVDETLTEQQARMHADAALQAADAAVKDYAAFVLMNEARDLAQQRQREESRQKAMAEQSERFARQGRKALERLFGRGVAAQVEPHQHYDIVQEWVGEKLYAVPTGQGEAVVAALNRAGGNADLSSRAGPGYRLGAVVGPLGKDFPLAAVVSGEEGLAEAVELVRADLAERREADERERVRKAEESAAVRQADSERRTFGTVVGDE